MAPASGWRTALRQSSMESVLVGGLSERKVWQFLDPVAVEIQRIDTRNWVEAKLTDVGRMKEAVFWIDIDTILQ